MKSDLDRLMQEAGLDALLVTGPRAHNPSLTYFTGPVHLSWAELFKQCGRPPVLFCRLMERDEAALTGLQTKSIDDYKPVELLERVGGDTARQRAMLYQRMCADLGIRGRLAVTGQADLGLGFATLQHLQALVPELEIVGAVGDLDVITRARGTKDACEVDRIRQMGKVTTSVAADVANFLTAHRVRNGVLVNQHDEVLTIAEVKRRINLWLAMRGAENPEGTIFAIGRDAGVPHSSGTDSAPVEIGKTIVFDLFPCEVGGGYFYDFTRTWCLGHAPDEALRAYEDVLMVQQEMATGLRADAVFQEYQRRTCEAFEARGHPTIQGTPGTTDGYVHSLGHGVGLAVHELPFSGYSDQSTDLLQPGSVVTVEPGLYYPESGFGVRIEDTVWIRPDGAPEVLADFPRELLLKVQDA
jgi:Xaa-Pro aminopeptidase